MTEIAALFLRLGCTAFGGPAAHITLMETAVVTERAWVSRAEFLDLLGVVQVLPGPNSTELAVHLGAVRGGWRGGVLAGLCFVLPSVVMVWLLAVLASGAAAQRALPAMLWWSSPVVLAVLVDALWRFGRQASARAGAPVILPLVTLAAILVPSDLLLLGLGALLAMAWARTPRAGGPRIAALVAAFVAGAGMLGASAAAATVATPPGTGALFAYFLGAGVSVFGSGYVLLGIFQHDLVTQRGWLSMAALTQASALAQVTPGPLFATATAAGYAIGGHAGALAATVGIFAPAFASVAVGAPLRRWIGRTPTLRAALDGVVLASVALLGRAVVGFAEPLRAWQWLLVVVSLLVLVLRRGASTWLILLSAAAGLVAGVLHFIPS